MARELARTVLRWLVICAAAAYILQPAPAGTANVPPPVDTEPVLEQYAALAEQVATMRERWTALVVAAEERRAAIRAGVECGLSPEASAAVWSAEQRYDLPEGLLLAVIKHESRCTPWLVNVNRNGSWDGGLAQLNSGTWRWLADMVGIEDPNPFDELHNIEMGAWYLAWLLDRHGNVEAALGAYNRGEAGFAAYVEAYGTTSTDYSRAVLAQWGGE